MSTSALFHPAVARWFSQSFPEPTKPQAEAWPLIRQRQNVLIAAPTGSGKTLAAFLSAIDGLIRQGVRSAAPRRDAGRLRLAAQGAVERHPEQPRRAARRNPSRARGARAAGRRHPHARAHRRHAAERASGHAAAPAAYRRHDTRVALRAARLGIGPQDARDDPNGDRRRDPCARRQQARQPPRVVARAAGRVDGQEARTDRAFGDAKADRRDRALPGRRRRRGREGEGTAVRDRRHRSRAPARPRARRPFRSARSGDVARGLGTGLRAARGARAGSPHDAHLRQHAPDGGARGSSSVRAPRPRPRDVASRQHGQGAAAQGRAAAQARRAQGPRRDRLARARHRHRRRRPRVPARIAALDRDLPAARGPREPSGRRDTEGAALSAFARRAGRVRRAARCGAARRARPAGDSTQAARRARATDRRRGRRGRMVRKRSLRSRASRVSVCGAHARRVSRRRADAGRRLHDASRTRRRVRPPRRGERRAARTPRRASHRAHVRRRDSRHRRLRGRAGAGQPGRRHGERGLRRREPRRRHLPARQYVVQDPTRRSGPRAGRGRARPGADDSLLARRGARTDRRVVERRVEAARRSRSRGSTKRATRQP